MRDGYIFHQIVAKPKNEKRLAKVGSAMLGVLLSYLSLAGLLRNLERFIEEIMKLGAMCWVCSVKDLNVKYDLLFEAQVESAGASLNAPGVGMPRLALIRLSPPSHR